MTDELPMTLKTLALALDVNIRTIVRLEKKGLPVMRIGRLHRYYYSEVVKWLKENHNKRRKWL